MPLAGSFTSSSRASSPMRLSATSWPLNAGFNIAVVAANPSLRQVGGERKQRRNDGSRARDSDAPGAAFGVQRSAFGGGGGTRHAAGRNGVRLSANVSGTAGHGWVTCLHPPPLSYGGAGTNMPLREPHAKVSPSGGGRRRRRAPSPMLEPWPAAANGITMLSRRAAMLPHRCCRCGCGCGCGCACGQPQGGTAGGQERSETSVGEY
eukprot:362539-Chlamydomonas_euryale.AAC.5